MAMNLHYVRGKYFFFPNPKYKTNFRLEYFLSMFSFNGKSEQFYILWPSVWCVTPFSIHACVFDKVLLFPIVAGICTVRLQNCTLSLKYVNRKLKFNIHTHVVIVAAQWWWPHELWLLCIQFVDINKIYVSSLECSP